jgi:hypothetical protein
MRYQYHVHAHPIGAEIMFTSVAQCFQAGVALLALSAMSGCSVVGATVAVGSAAVSAATTVGSAAVSVASTVVETTYDVGKAGVKAAAGSDSQP